MAQIIPVTWDAEADVVIIGYGGAGATAAIAAYDKGVKILILEKAASGGGNTRLAGGGIVIPTSMEAVKHFEALCFGKTDKEIIQSYVETAIKTPEWIRELGGESKIRRIMEIMFPFPTDPFWPNAPALNSIVLHRVVGGEEGGRPAAPLWKLLSSNVERRGINIMYNTPARELATNEMGEVIGVLATSEGKDIAVKAKKAVILTCGGFQCNEAMKDTYLPLTPIYPFGCPGNTGDGITMAQKIGAALWHMYHFVGYLAFWTPEYEAAFQIRFYGPRFIYVDKDGRRFTNETGWEAHEVWKSLTVYRPDGACYPHLPAYGILDEVARKKGPLYPVKSGRNWDNYEWSLDNSKEIAKGWVKKGETIRELAREIQVDESNLEKTVARYNECCKNGRDNDFNRSKEYLEAIDTPPYYAIEFWPCIVNTLGGPRRNKDAMIVNSEGKPIPRLYSAGELGSMWGFLYGGNLGECLAFGRIAGQNAAAQQPWC